MLTVLLVALNVIAAMVLVVLFILYVIKLAQRTRPGAQLQLGRAVLGAGATFLVTTLLLGWRLT